MATAVSTAAGMRLVATDDRHPVWTLPLLAALALATLLRSGALAAELELRSTGGDEGNKPSKAKLVVIADDYDVLTASGSSPLSRLTKYLPMADGLDLHVILTRKVRSASRGMYESFFSTLRDAGTAALIMSGDRSEG